MLLKTTLFLLALTFTFSGFSQEAWSLQKCVQHARQNNLSLKQSEIAISQAELTEKGSRMARLPNLNASTNFGLQYGRSIDRTTNDFINEKLGFNNLSMNANLTVYNGGRIKNSIKQSQYDLEAAKEDANTQFQNIALQMAAAYLNVLLANEQVTIAQKALGQSNTQLSQIDKRIDAGVLPKSDRLDIIAQIARNEQTLITAQNTVEINYLSLKNLLELEPDYDLKIEIPQELMSIETNTEMFSLGSVYSQALTSQPSIKASEIRMKSSELAIPIAKAGALPTVTLFAGLDTRWSSVAKRQNGIIENVLFEEPVQINGEDVTLGRFFDVPTFADKYLYTDQLNDNFGQNFGVAINIPIYNNHQASINIERARLEIINAEVQNRQAKQQLKADVQNAIANARAARTELAASEKSLEAAKAASENAEKRYRLGAINTLELTTAKTNLDTAELNVVRAKYDYVFRLKIIDFYLGKELKLK